MVPRIWAVMAILAVPACGGDDDSNPANAGGSSNAGGARTGGRAPTAGVSPVGGAGGANGGATAGAPTTGGRAATGGVSPVGGAGTGGRANTGGVVATGGVSPVGGAGGAGGQNCINCGISNCMTSALACYAVPDCQAIITCAVSASCQDLACIDTCAAQYPAGQSALAPLITCAQTNCATACGLG